MDNLFSKHENLTRSRAIKNAEIQKEKETPGGKILRLKQGREYLRRPHIREKNKKYRKEIKLVREGRGVCIKCGSKKEDIRFKDCLKCKEKFSQYHKKIILIRKAKGVCTMCGSKKEDIRFKRCLICRKKCRDYFKEYYLKKKMEKQNDN